MSGWQPYIDDSLLGTGTVDKAVIFGHDGSVWAHSPLFELTDEERNHLVSAFKDPSGIRANGLHLNREKVRYTPFFPESLAVPFGIGAALQSY